MVPALWRLNQKIEKFEASLSHRESEPGLQSEAPFQTDTPARACTPAHTPPYFKLREKQDPLLSMVKQNRSV